MEDHMLRKDYDYRYRLKYYDKTIARSNNIAILKEKRTSILNKMRRNPNLEGWFGGAFIEGVVFSPENLKLYEAHVVPFNGKRVTIYQPMSV